MMASTFTVGQQVWATSHDEDGEILYINALNHILVRIPGIDADVWVDECDLYNDQKTIVNWWAS